METSNLKKAINKTFGILENSEKSLILLDKNNHVVTVEEAELLLEELRKQQNPKCDRVLKN